MTTIKIPKSLYEQLWRYAVGFGDTPAKVIERLVTHANNTGFRDANDNFNQGLFGDAVSEENSEKTGFPAKKNRITVKVTYFPNGDEEAFKRDLLEKREAFIKIIFDKGSPTIHRWKAHRLSKTSSIRVNLFTGVLRKWRKDGVREVYLSTNRDEVEKAGLNHAE